MWVWPAKYGFVDPWMHQSTSVACYKDDLSGEGPWNSTKTYEYLFWMSLSIYQAEYKYTIQMPTGCRVTAHDTVTKGDLVHLYSCIKGL